MKNKSRNIPLYRFKGFTDAWDQRKLGEVFKYEQPTKYLVTATDYNPSYTIPVLTAGKSFILGYTNETQNLKEATEDNPVIIFDDFTTSSHYVDFPFKIKSSAMKLLDLKSKDDNFYFMFHVLKNITYVPENHERHWISKFSAFDIRITKSEEQAAIGTFFSTLDSLITLHQRECDRLSDVKRIFLQKMFPKNDEAIPEFRFDGFTDAWDQRKLGDFGKATGGISIESEFSENGKYKVISIGSYSERSTYTDQGIRVNKTQKTEQKICNKNDLTMILNDKTASGNIIGRVLLIDADDSYVFNQRTERIEVDQLQYNSNFLYSMLNADGIRSKIIRAAQGNTQIYVNWSVISHFIYLVPLKIAEQTAIGNFFSTLDTLLALHQRQYELLKNMKKSLLKQMFI